MSNEHDHDHGHEKAKMMKAMAVSMMGTALSAVVKKFKPTNGSLDDPRGENLEKFIEMTMPSAMYIFLMVVQHRPKIVALENGTGEEDMVIATLFISMHAMEDGIHPDWYDAFAVRPTQGAVAHSGLKEALINHIEGDGTAKIPESIEVVVSLLRR